MMKKYKLYKNTIQLSFDDKKHIYSEGGKPVDGVTGILRVIAKPALIQWSANQAVEYIERAWSSLDDEVQMKQMFNEAKYAHRKTADTAATIGTLVHEWIERHIQGVKQLEPKNKQIKQCVEAYLEWEKMLKPEYLDTERIVYSRKNRFAGRFDVLLKMDGSTYITDIKTSTGIYPDYWLQLAGYRIAYQEEVCKRVDGLMIIRIGKDGKLEYRVQNNEEEALRLAFTNALHLHRALKRLQTL